MLTDLGESNYSFLEFEVAPPLLDPVGCPSLNNHVNGVLFEGTAEVSRSDGLLDHGDIGSAIKQGLKEAQELLILVRVNRPVVVKDGEQDRQHQLD